MIAFLQPGQKIENKTGSDILVFLDITGIEAKELYHQLMELKNNLSGQMTLIDDAPEVYKLLSTLHQTYAVPTKQQERTFLKSSTDGKTPPHSI